MEENPPKNIFLVNQIYNQQTTHNDNNKNPT